MMPNKPTEEACESLLNNVESMATIDSEAMLKAVERFPDNCEHGLEIASKMDFSAFSGGIDCIAVLGMGGSAISGDIVSAITEDEIRCPFFTFRSYNLPAFIGSGTLAIAVSYSGNTEETISCANEALSRGAFSFAICSGGALETIYKEYGLPVISIPKGLQPRAAAGYLAIPIMIALERLGLYQGMEIRVRNIIRTLRESLHRYGSMIPYKDNPAKKMAAKLFNKTAVIYGTNNAMSTAAYRWKCQINENAKVPAFFHTIPEMNHNEIVGWRDSAGGNNYEILILDDSGIGSRNYLRVKTTAELIENDVSGVHIISAGEGSLDSRLFRTIFLGDFISVYLAILNGVDPSPVERIARLKVKLEEE